MISSKTYKPRECPGFHTKPHMFAPRRGQKMCDECVERQRKYNQELIEREKAKKIQSAAKQEAGQQKRKELLDKNRETMDRMRAMRNKGFRT